MDYTFVIDHTDAEEIALHTKEVFKNLFISKQPSRHEEVGYELIDDTIVIKYEQTEDERLVVDAIRIPHYTLAHLPTIFGAVVAHHHAIKLKIGTIVLNVSVVVNEPNGAYYNEREADGTVIRHAVNGHIFKQHGNRYVSVTDNKTLHDVATHLKLNLGQFVAQSLLVRFMQGEKMIYAPLAYCFHDPRVANAMNKKITASDWAMKREEINPILNALGDRK